MNHAISVFLSQCVSDQLQSRDRWSERSEGLEWHSVHAERLGLENMEAVTSAVASTPTCLCLCMCERVCVSGSACLLCFCCNKFQSLCLHTCSTKPTIVKCTQINRPPSVCHTVCRPFCPICSVILYCV